jgi:hypothetical protein
MNAANAGNRTFLSKVGDLAKSPFVPLKAGSIPTWTQWTGATVSAGTFGAGVYNLGSNYFNSAAAFDKGDSSIRPEKAVADSFKLFNENGFNPSNIYLQSLQTGWMLGGSAAKVASPLLKSPITTWAMSRAENPGILGLGKSALATSGSTLWQGARWMASSIPAEDATIGQQLRQGMIRPIPFLTGYTAYEAHGGMEKASAPWEDSLANLNQPIKNEAHYHLPTVNMKTGQIVDDGSDDSSDQSAGNSGQKSGQAPDKSNQKPAKADKPGGSGQSSNNSGDGSDLNPDIQGNIQ